MTKLIEYVAQFIVWVVGFFGKKATAIATVGAAFLAGWAALQALLYVTWTTLGFVLPEMMIKPMQLVAYVLPTNFSACIAAMMAGKIARWLWDVQIEWIKTSSAAN